MFHLAKTSKNKSEDKTLANFVMTGMQRQKSDHKTPDVIDFSTVSWPEKIRMVPIAVFYLIECLS